MGTSKVGRSSGRSDMHCCVSSANAGGASGGSVRRRWRIVTAITICVQCMPLQARLPVYISQHRTPNAYASAHRMHFRIFAR